MPLKFQGNNASNVNHVIIYIFNMLFQDAEVKISFNFV